METTKRERDRDYSEGRYLEYNRACERAIRDLGGECEVCGNYDTDTLALFAPVPPLRVFSTKTAEPYMPFLERLRAHNTTVRCPQHRPSKTQNAKRKKVVT